MAPNELVELWVKTFNRADADGLVSFYAEDAVNHQVAEAFVSGLTASGTCWSLRGCGFFHVIAHKIVFQRGYWDKLSFLRQQGLPLPKQ